jgi:hypothetical protein
MEHQGCECHTVANRFEIYDQQIIKTSPYQAKYKSMLHNNFTANKKISVKTYDYYLISINFNFHSKFLTQYVDTMPELFLLYLCNNFDSILEIPVWALWSVQWESHQHLTVDQKPRHAMPTCRDTTKLVLHVVLLSVPWRVSLIIPFQWI